MIENKGKLVVAAGQRHYSNPHQLIQHTSLEITREFQIQEQFISILPDRIKPIGVQLRPLPSCGLLWTFDSSG